MSELDGAVNDQVRGGDPCPRCGAELGYDEQEAPDGMGGTEWQPFLTHPELRCGWLADGYPSSREGLGEPPSRGNYGPVTVLEEA